MMNRTKLMCAACMLVLTAAAASAMPARVATDLNVRSGEGTGFPVIATMPAGAVVDVTGCADGWCFVRDYGGFASASYLDGAPSVVTSYAAPPAVVAVPGPVYSEPYYYSRPRPYAAQRAVRHAVRQFGRAVRHEARQDRREARHEMRQEMRQDRREARQDRRASRQERGVGR